MVGRGNLGRPHRLGPRCCLGPEHWTPPKLYCHRFAGKSRIAIFRSRGKIPSIEPLYSVLSIYMRTCVHALCVIFRIRPSSSGRRILRLRLGSRPHWTHQPVRIQQLHLEQHQENSLTLYGASPGHLQGTSWPSAVETVR